MPKTFGLAMGLLTILGAAGATNCWETACFANDSNDFMRKISWAVDHVLLRKNDSAKNVYGGLRHSCGVAHCGGGHGGAAHGSAGDVHETGKRHCGKRSDFNLW